MTAEAGSENTAREQAASRDEREVSEVTFLNPFTCGVYKDGGRRYKIDPRTGRRTEQVDDELGDQVERFVTGDREVPGVLRVPMEDAFENQVLVPRYYDQRYLARFRKLLEREGLEAVSLGELLDDGIIEVRGGHGSPGNDNRTGDIPYIKVSDIRSLKVNVNPTNLVTETVARSFWRGDSSGLMAWDLITPNRASSNIGEFAILLPGEERILLTKEVFVIRVAPGGTSEVSAEHGFDPFYLLWALCLKAVREQWQRITLMQTNREDVGQRYREILIPRPPNPEWAKTVSAPFRDYFTTVANAREQFSRAISSSGYEYIASALTTEEAETEETREL